MRTMVMVVALTAGAVGVTGCATATRGTSQDWRVQSIPSGARVSTTNGYRCDATPCSFRMPRRSQFVATLSLPGHQTVEASIDHRLSNGGAGATAGNVLLGGFIGMGVDAASGANQDIRPNPLVVRMTLGSGTILLNWQQAEGESASATANGSGTTASAPRP